MKQMAPILLLIFALFLVACGGSSATPTLNGTSWVLSQIGDQPVLPGTNPTLVFEDGQVSGNSSCNHFGGSYEVNGEKLTFGPLFSTLMACLDEGVMEQEGAYLAALQSTATYQVKDGRLLILDASGKVVLTFNSQQ